MLALLVLVVVGVVKLMVGVVKLMVGVVVALYTEAILASIGGGRGFSQSSGLVIAMTVPR